LRNAYTEYAKPQIIGETPGWEKTVAARRENNKLEEQIQLRRKKWRILPPENMTVIMLHTTGAFEKGLTLSVPHEIGRLLLHKRLASIRERDDVTIDALIDGSFEDAIEAMNLGPINATEVSTKEEIEIN